MRRPLSIHAESSTTPNNRLCRAIGAPPGLAPRTSDHSLGRRRPDRQLPRPTACGLICRADCYAERMRGRALRRAIPAPIVRRIQGLIRFAYWLRWRFRVLAGKRAALPAGALDCVVAGNKHGVYCVPRSSRHRPAAQAILQSRVWEPDTLDLVGGTDRDGDIVHAGTFFGDFLPALARSRRNGASCGRSSRTVKASAVLRSPCC